MVRVPGSRWDRWTRPEVQRTVWGLWGLLLVLKWGYRVSRHGIRDAWDAVAAGLVLLAAVCTAVAAARFAVRRLRLRAGRRAVGRPFDQG